MKTVIMGASSGGIDAWKAILPALDVDTPAAFILLQHQKADCDSSLADFLDNFSSLPIHVVEDQMTMRPGHIYFAPANYHLLINSDHSFSLDVSPLINFSRPAIDITMMSAASVFQQSLIGVLLTGANSDGALGMKKIKQLGGKTLVEDPCSAMVSYMPEQAISLCQPDFQLKKELIAPCVNQILANKLIPTFIN